MTALHEHRPKALPLGKGVEAPASGERTTQTIKVELAPDEIQGGTAW